VGGSGGNEIGLTHRRF